MIAAVERLAGIEEELAGRACAHRRLRRHPLVARAGATRRSATTSRQVTGRRRSSACNDRIAMGVYQAAHEFGMRVPDDVSVVSFDDSDLAGWLRPKLTSVAIPHFEMGRRAVELLLDPARRSDRAPGADATAHPGIGRSARIRLRRSAACGITA